jgi:radical SAM superfamily enzyme YgiQ (UPF0313 family)
MMVKNETVDVLFIHVPKLTSYYKPFDEFMFINYIPMGVFALCDILNKNNIRSKIKHLGLEYIQDESFSIVDYIKTNQINTVALSLHWHYQAYDVIEIARKIKAAAPGTKVILGGITASFFAEEIVKEHEFIDFIIAGDGEKGILELAGFIKAGGNDFSGVSNCIYRKDGKIINNGITFVADYGNLENIDYGNLDYLDHHEEYKEYFKLPLFWLLNSSVKENMDRKISGATTTFPLMVGRGCPVNCSFCGGGKDAQKKICNREQPAFRPVSQVVDTMEQAIGYGYESFIICFDPYPKNDSYYIELFAEIRNRKLSCGMGFESWGLPTQRFVEEFGKTFVKGISYIALSPETFSETVRKANKGFFYTNEEMFHMMQFMKEQDTPAIIYLTIGLSGETLKDIHDTVRFSKKLRKQFPNLLGIITVPVQLEPGSPMFENPRGYNAVTERRCFRDFYEYHQRPESNPYTYLGYVTEALAEAGGDMSRFHELILNERCKHFCMIQIKLFGKFQIPALSRLICKLNHKRWLRSGFGKPPLERRTFG